MNLKRLIVALDSGHGGRDGGAKGRLHPEKWYNKEVTEEVRRLLLMGGAWPLTLRWSNELRGIDNKQHMRLRDRVAVINAFRAGDGRPVDLVLCIHHNGATWPRAGGVEVWHYPKSVKGTELGRSVLKQMALMIPFRNRGLRHTRRLAMLKRPKPPSIITEGCFVTNPTEENWLVENCHVEAAAIVQGLRNAELG